VGPNTHYGFILRDISDRKRIEQSLVAEKDHLVTTLQSIDEGIITTDREGRITFFNPLAEHITEWSHEEVVTRPLQEVFRVTNETSNQKEHTALHFSPGSSALAEPDTPLQLMTKHGLQRTISMRETPIRDQSSQLLGTVIMFHDITDQHRHHDEQQRISKLNSLGVLAGGLAHDFNNLLTAILGNVFVAKLRMTSQDPIAQNLEQAEQACLRAKELTQQLLTFAKGGSPIKTSIALGDLLRKSAIFALSGSSISCLFDIPNDLWPLNADGSQLRQVIQNITINARQAMSKGGHFSIRVENTSFPTLSELPSPTLSPGDYVQIAFEDQGEGIHDQAMPNIFDPYFSTKPEASGLGLATAHSIIQQHYGHISVRSEVGKGTTFTVYLPSSHSSVDIEPHIIPQGHGRILVMDDEHSIRQMVTDALTQFGYDVTVTANGQATIDVFAEALTNDNAFDAVLLDLTIPDGMGGKEAIQHLLHLDPHVKAIVTSGYSDDPIMSDFKAYGFQGILVKPYKITDLAKTLESLCSLPK
jgi:PAS domain S-box-containing protein